MSGHAGVVNPMVPASVNYLPAVKADALASNASAAIGSRRPAIDGFDNPKTAVYDVFAADSRKFMMDAAVRHYTRQYGIKSWCAAAKLRSTIFKWTVICLHPPRAPTHPSTTCLLVFTAGGWIAMSLVANIQHKRTFGTTMASGQPQQLAQHTLGTWTRRSGRPCSAKTCKTTS